MFDEAGKNLSWKKIIYIVEDNQVYARSLQSFIHTRFAEDIEIRLYSIGETCMLDMHNHPDIVIIDYLLNTKHESADNGLGIINQIKAIQPQTNIIVLSEQHSNDVINEVEKHPNCTYIQKDIEAFSKVEVLIIKIFDDKNLRLSGLLIDPANLSAN